MFGFGPLAFAEPLLLTALIGLPVIYWLLRLLPPVPRRVPFPALRLLMDLKQEEQTPANTPWWLLLFRLLIATLLILGLADPILNPTAQFNDDEALVIVVDDGWPAASNWTTRQAALNGLIDQAARENKPVLILPTAAAQLLPDTANALDLLTPADARGVVQSLEPKAWLPDRTQVEAQLGAIGEGLADQDLKADVVWLSDGLDYGSAAAFGGALEALGTLTVFEEPVAALPVALLPPEGTGNGFDVTALRASGTGSREAQLRVLGPSNRLLGYGRAAFEDNAKSATVSIEMPLELRNEATRIEVENQSAAGSVVLLDERWRRRLIGLVSTSGAEDTQPLLSDVYYIERALAPYTEVRKGSLSGLLEQPVSILVLSDVGQIVGEDLAAVENWVERGGMLIRFAGPRLAAQSDDLIPVELRQGGRALGGALSWAEPQVLSPFEEISPFYGLKIPEDVTVSRQVLAQPSIELPQRTWAQLEDGTPLVTAETRGKGRIVLFHITAAPEWSNLPFSGLYVEMLQRLSALSAGVSPLTGDGTAEATDGLPAPAGISFRPLRTMNGFGALTSPPPTASPIPGRDFDTTTPGPDTPPGLYGTEQATFALNPVAEDFSFTLNGSLPAGAARTSYSEDAQQSLKPWLLMIALTLILIDGIIALVLSGRLRPRGMGPVGQMHAATVPNRARSAALILGAFVAATATLFLAGQSFAQDTSSPAADNFALRATLQTPLAYIITGQSDVDDMSKAGLTGLSRILRERTAMEPAEPLGIDIENDELAFFPLIYWPVVDTQGQLSAQALAKIDGFMKNGGTILFDTQDHQSNIPGISGSGATNRHLRQLLAALDIPPLEPVPEDHVLTKAFYLLQDFPGRWSGGRLWVEARRSGSAAAVPVGNDGVSAIIIGSNDYAAAWAEDEYGRQLAAVVPGGRRQRELAYRFGVNLMMYTLTGNYKADQVHVPALLERLGQ